MTTTTASMPARITPPHRPAVRCGPTPWTARLLTACSACSPARRSRSPWPRPTRSPIGGPVPLAAAELAVERARYQAERAERGPRRGRTREPSGGPQLRKPPRGTPLRAGRSRGSTRDRTLPREHRCRPGPSSRPSSEISTNCGPRRPRHIATRKRLLRTLVADVTLIPDPDRSKLRIGIHWHSGSTEELIVQRMQRITESRRTAPDAVALARFLGPGLDNHALAAELNAADRPSHRRGARLRLRCRVLAAPLPRDRLTRSPRARRAHRARCRLPSRREPRHHHQLDQPRHAARSARSLQPMVHPVRSGRRVRVARGTSPPARTCTPTLTIEVESPENTASPKWPGSSASRLTSSITGRPPVTCHGVAIRAAENTSPSRPRSRRRVVSASPPPSICPPRSSPKPNTP